MLDLSDHAEVKCNFCRQKDIVEAGSKAHELSLCETCVLYDACVSKSAATQAADPTN